MTNIMAKLVVARDAAQVQYDTLNEILNEMASEARTDGGCAHENRQDITAAGDTKTKYACPDCGKTWEGDDAS